jgi:hypothetical protein
VTTKQDSPKPTVAEIAAGITVIVIIVLVLLGLIGLVL